CQNFALEQLVKDSDAAGFNDYVSVARGTNRLQGIFLLLTAVNDDSGPFRISHVAMFLPTIGIGLIKGYAVTPLSQCPNQSSIVGCCAIPIRRNQARSEEGDFHNFESNPSITYLASSMSALVGYGSS